MYYYAQDYGEQRELPIEEILRSVRDHPESVHHVWREGMEDWTDIFEVPELAEQLHGAGDEPRPEAGQPFRYTVNGKHQRPALAKEIADRLKAEPGVIMKVWQDDFLWWPHAQEVPEIAQHGPLPPIQGSDGEAVLYRVKLDSKQLREMGVEEVASLVRAEPSRHYQVWRIGMDRWASPWEVAALRERGLGPEPVPEMGTWMLTVKGRSLNNLTAVQVAEAIRESGDVYARVWRIGMSAWESAWSVDEISSLGIGSRSDKRTDEVWSYTCGRHRENSLTREQIIDRVAQDPEGPHEIWQVGMDRWEDPYGLEGFQGLLPERNLNETSRLLLYSRDRKNHGYMSAEHIVVELERYPESRHMVWPHLTSSWLHPWEVEELYALGVRVPPDQAESVWHYRQNDVQKQNWKADQIAIAVMKNPTADHQVWQYGWHVWEDPRDVPAIAKMLPREDR